MSVCAVIRTREEAHALSEFALRFASGMEETVKIWIVKEVAAEDQ